MRKLRKLFTNLMVIAIVTAILIACNGLYGDVDGLRPDKDKRSEQSFTIFFNANGGTPAPGSQTISIGDTVDKPGDPKYSNSISTDYDAGLYKNDLAFLGWYIGEAEWDFESPVTGSITLMAKWGSPELIDVSNQAGSNIIEKAVNYVKAIPAAYTLLLDTNIPELLPQTLSGNGLSITLLGKDSTCTISLSDDGYYNQGAMFIVNSSATLVLDNNITLQGRSLNNTSLVIVNAGGKLEMNKGSVICGNTNYSNNGGGVYIGGSGSTFTMNGGEISDNTTKDNGGGVYVWAGGTFTMGGKAIISDNKAWSGGGVFVFGAGSFIMSDEATISDNSGYWGGGVYVSDSGNVTINGGEISENNGSTGGGVLVRGGYLTLNGGIIASNTTATGQGGGVLVEGGTFIFKDGTITKNTVNNGGGGGVCVNGNSNENVFTMTGGEISGNSAVLGGGVSVMGSGIKFEMDGGIITGNTASRNNNYGGYAGGVSVEYGSQFIMSGTAKISGNGANTGGGVYVAGASSDGDESSFKMNGGIISGNAAEFGSGVYVTGDRYGYGDGSFIMRGGTISGNIAASSGGGVYVNRGSFAKEGGTIFGYSAGDTSNSNAVRNGSGTILNNQGHTIFTGNDYYAIKRKETNAGPTVNLSYYYNDGAPVWSGDWDDDLTNISLGTEAYPYLVYDEMTFKKVGRGTDSWNLSAYYKQTADIRDAYYYDWTPIGNATAPFTGNYDGSGYEIKNMDIYGNTDNDYYGLFGYTGEDALITNVKISYHYVHSGTAGFGGIVGYNSGTVRNCSVMCNESRGGTNVGGMVGYNCGTVENCYSTGNFEISGNTNVGGVMGYNSGTVKNCYVTSPVSGVSNVGGVVGYNDGTVQNCVTLGHNVIATGENIGRVTGQNTSDLINNFARSDMFVNGNTVITATGPTTEHGAGISSTQWSSESWWKSVAPNGPVFDISSTGVWEWNGTLPILKNFSDDPFYNSELRYIITINSNGATSGTASYTYNEAYAGSSITLPGVGSLARTGYTFGGWNTETDGTGTTYPASSSYTPSGNIILYAKWN